MTTADLFNPTTKETLYQAKFDQIPTGFQLAASQGGPSTLTNQVTPSMSPNASPITVTPNAPIAANTLSNPIQPYKTAPTPIPTAGAGLSGAISTATASNGRQANETPEQYMQRTDPVSLANFKAANPGLNFEESDLSNYLNPNSSNTDLGNQKGTVDTQRQSLFDRLFNRPSKTSLQDTAYANINDTGSSVNSAKKELNDINNQILAEQTSSRHQIEALQKAGGSVGGIALQTAQIQKDSLSKQADLAVIQQAKQNNYSLAKEIADRKVDALLEDDKNKIDALTFLYKENKDQFTKDEQRQYEAKLKSEERAYTEKSTELKTIKDFGLKYLQEGGDAKTALKIFQAKSLAELAPLQTQITSSQDAAVAPEVLQGMLNVYKSTGVLPAFGMSAKSPLRAQFYAALGGQNGGQIVNDANTNKAVRVGLQTAYRTQQNQLSANETAVNTLEQQLGLAQQYSDKVNRSGSPLVNKYLLSVKNGVFGDPDTAVLHNIVTTASYELAKILSGSAASVAGATVSSQADAESLLNSAMSKGQFNEVLGLMKKEAQFRLNSQRDTLKSLEKDLSNVGNVVSEAAKTGSQTVQSNGNTYTVGQVYRDGSGANWTVDANGKWTRQ